MAVNHTSNLPNQAGLPPELRLFPLNQAVVLRLDPAEWAGDIRTLSEVLVQRGFVREPIPPQPVPSAKIKRTPPLTPGQLAAAFKQLPEWEEWSDSLALEYPRVRHELRRTFTFENFREAIEFMNFVAPRFEKTRPPHHPRWANEWNVVRIRLTTWDAGNKITKLDVATALMVDAAYGEFRSRS
ncbi:MAG: transcriptional coactivator/pterin dehydratase [Acidobacteria bacterium]|nr:transcriptional coactivator/pterin dehydratase [Acidobacteriota bacterium]